MMPDRTFGEEYAPAQPQRLWPERLAGVVAVLGCCLLLGCLFTYRVEEVGWSALNPAGHEKAADIPCTNMLGVCGMYLAGLLYWLLGAGAVYGFLLALVPTCGMVWRPLESRAGQWVALVVMLLTACACLSVQPWVLTEWAEKLSLTTPGGKLGYLDGTCVTEALLGKSWALTLLLVVHAVALIYFARFTPKKLFVAEKEDIMQLGRRWKERRERAREARRLDDRAWMRSEPEEPPMPARQNTLPGWTDPQPNMERENEPEEEPSSRQAPPQPRRAVPALARDDYEDEPPRRVVPARARDDYDDEPPRRAPAPASHDLLDDGEPLPRSRMAMGFDDEPAPMPRQRVARRTVDDIDEPRQPRDKRRVPPHSKSDNMLDLMKQVEDEIERQSYGSVDEDDRADDEDAPMPINRYTQEAVNRHFGFAPEKKPVPAAAPPAPRSPRRSEPPRPAPRVSTPPPAKEEESDYPMPPYELLKYEPVSLQGREEAEIEKRETQATIIEALASFRINVEPDIITRGPSVTRYEFSMPPGQSVKAVAGKRNDLMAATQSPSVNILAPVPGKSTVGVELENRVKESVYLRELLQSDAFHSPKVRIPVALGKDVYGNPVIGDLAAMPHVLVAGSTGSGKSVCINSMLVSMLYKFRPDELRLVLVDPKVVEMQPYKKLPHLAVPVVTDPTRVIGALRWAVNEMERRYKYFSKMGVRNLEDFNNLPPDAKPVDADEPEAEESEVVDLSTADAIVRDVEDSQGMEIPDEEEEQGELDFIEANAIPSKLPYIVIVIDELADLMIQVKEDLENCIFRLTAKARAAGIHLIVATQSPRASVVTGIIKTNLPSRIALKVTSQLDSRVILDEGGAENLLGRGDLLFLPPGGPTKMTRAQGAFVSDDEIASIIQFCAAHAKQNFVQSAKAAVEEDAPAAGGSGKGGRGGTYEPGGASSQNEELYTRCVNLVVTERKASITLLQRRFRIGYGKAAEIMEMMEKRGVVSPANGTSRPREVLIEAPE